MSRMVSWDGWTDVMPWMLMLVSTTTWRAKMFGTASYITSFERYLPWRAGHCMQYLPQRMSTHSWSGVHVRMERDGEKDWGIEQGTGAAKSRGEHLVRPAGRTEDRP